MSGWILAMLSIGGLLIVRDMAKTVFRTRKSRITSEIYDKHPQKEQMERYALSFQKLADTFYNMPYRKERLSNGEKKEILDHLQEEVCVGCSRYDSCWKLCYYLNYQHACDMIGMLEEGDVAKINQAQGDWMLHCINGSRYLEQLKRHFFYSRQTLAWNNKIIENRLAVAEQLGEVASIMKKTAEDIYSINTVPENLEEQVRKLLRKQHVIVKKMWMLEKPAEKIQIYITMRARAGQSVTFNEIARQLSRICDANMKAVKEGQRLLNSEYTTVLFTEDVNYRVLYGVAKVTKEHESISGDNYTCTDGDGKFVMCLSDGMGSGLEASRESEAVVELLEQFLTSGFSQETATKMINSALVLQHNDGMFSTVDLCSLDLYSGVCEFLKAGAATTFIKREQWVETITSTSFAAGLVQQLDFEVSSKKIYNGDYVIMVTDGVLDALPLAKEEETMKEIIMNIPGTAPKELGRNILEQVMAYCDYRAKDDMTVLVAGIWEK